MTELTHYVVPFAARAICGAISPHAGIPSCPTCLDALVAEEQQKIERIKASLKRYDARQPCLDGSTANCVPSAPLVDVPRCIYCRRELPAPPEYVDKITRETPACDHDWQDAGDNFHVRCSKCLSYGVRLK